MMSISQSSADDSPAARRVRGAAEQVADHPIVDAGARAGYAVNGLLHLLIGWLGLQVALGNRAAEADPSGAMAVVAGTAAGLVVAARTLPCPSTADMPGGTIRLTGSPDALRSECHGFNRAQDFRGGAIVSLVSKVHAGADLKETVRLAVTGLGGFSRFVSPGDSVLIKPNFNTADPLPASTDPAFLAAVVDLAYESGAARVVVGESSMLSPKKRSTQVTLTKAGVYELGAESRPAEIHIFDDHEWVEREIPRGRFLKTASLPKILDDVDRIILLPCCKTHAIAGFTGALKIAVGFMKPTERIKLHVGRVPEKVAELNTVYRPDLVIMDARRCFITGGPSRGEVRTPGLVLASRSRIGIDVEEVRIIQSYPGNALAGRAPEGLQQIRHARELGIA